MKKYIYFGLLIMGLTSVIIRQQERINTVKGERNLYKQNVNTLIDDIVWYQTQDSLNAVSVGQLELKLSEYKRYRKEDMELIETLKVDNKRLKSIVSAGTQTVYNVQTMVRDSFIYVDNVLVETMQCLTVHDKWFDIDGCTDRDGEFRGTQISRDSLLIVEHVIPRNFLFIRWGCKEKRVEAFSKNPNTKIVDFEYVKIRE